MNFIFGQNFRKTLTFLVLTELFSLFAFLIPQFMPYAFWIIVGFFLVICLWKIESGLYILLVELFIGSKGYLFFYEAGGVVISIRIALFLVFMAIWLSKLTTKSQIATKLKALYLNNKRIINYYLLIVTFIVIGLVNGLLRGRSFDNVFFDFNGWLYFTLLIPFLDLIKSQKVINNILQIFIATVTWIASKTLIVFYFFSHQFINFAPLYKWLRDSGVGEITMMSSNFYRIFFQSQIYVLIGFFILFINLLIYWLLRKGADGELEDIKNNLRRNLFLFFCFNVLMLSCLIVSFSRSFWAGWIGGLGAMFLFLKFRAQFSWPQIFKVAGALIVFFMISIGLVLVVMKLPPKMTGDQSFASLVEKRVTTSTGEAAGSSRINLLKPLLQENLKHPIIGAGFGATVTYQSNDPRIRNQLNPKGWYTTYAFEWGYLDIWLKIGLFGLAAYLGFIFLVMRDGYKFIIYHLSFIGDNQIVNDKCQMPAPSAAEGVNVKYMMGLLFGLVALLITNIFSPYLNHPLGIGYILLCGAIFRLLKNGADYSPVCSSLTGIVQ